MSTYEHPRHDLDGTLINPVRLSIAAALAEVDRAEFALVRDAVQVTGSALSKQVAILEAAGLVRVSKGRSGRYGRTWLALSPQGLEVFERHVDALRNIAAGASERTAGSATDGPEPDDDDLHEMIPTTRTRS